jgi:hypothetical protein
MALYVGLILSVSYITIESTISSTGWGMYENINNSRIVEKIQNAELLKIYFKKRKKVYNKCTSLVADVRKWMDATEICLKKTLKI